ncbi:PIN domain-containing protein [Ruegeria sp. HKCCA5463]|uniref:PIN domain-containing protein n=1 Tax=Ruegeria sp. HKCCA5463 TaxID=2682994 RepID=UPI001487D24B|nr:PIN domain-containing protein [Ruegeria sp. HKCCA5463]
MKYDALTIDTQVVYSNDLELDTGLLGQLDQFKDGLVQFLLSEIVVREIHKPLTEKAKATHDALNKAIRAGRSNGQLSDPQCAALEAIRDGMAKPSEHAKNQLSDFSKNTGAEIVSADTVDVKPLLERYFRNDAPFASKGKKSEFPDAIALLTLERWAIEKKKRILAVSNDGDWKSFAEQSEHIDVVEDLGEALEILNDLAEETIPLAKSVLSLVGAGDPDLAPKLRSFVEYAVDAECPYLEFDGPMPGEDEGASLTLVDFEIPGLDDDSTEIDIVRVGTQGFAFRVPVCITANVYAEISFSIRDSIDKDYVPMGSTSVEQEIEFDAFLLLEISHFMDDEDGEASVVYKIDNVELLDAPSSVDVGYIDHSLAEPDYDFEMEYMLDQEERH